MLHVSRFSRTAISRTSLEYEEDSWVARAEIEKLPPGEQWSWAFFHAASQLLAISVGVVPPMRTIELWLYLISMLLGATMCALCLAQHGRHRSRERCALAVEQARPGLAHRICASRYALKRFEQACPSNLRRYAVFVATVTSFFTDADPSAREYRAKVDMVNQYMRHSQLPANLREKLRTYYELRYPGGRAFDETKVVAELSAPLMQEVRMIKCKAVLSALNIIDTNATLAHELCGHLERTVFVVGDYIVRQSEVRPPCPHCEIPLPRPAPEIRSMSPWSGG